MSYCVGLSKLLNKFQNLGQQKRCGKALTIITMESPSYSVVDLDSPSHPLQSVPPTHRPISNPSPPIQQLTRLQISNHVLTYFLLDDPNEGCPSTSRFILIVNYNSASLDKTKSIQSYSKTREKHQGYNVAITPYYNKGEEPKSSGNFAAQESSPQFKTMGLNSSSSSH